MQKLFYELVGAGIDHGLVVTTEDLTRRSKPILALEGLYNWLDRNGHKDPETELAELCSGLPRRWFNDLRRIVQQESDARNSATNVA